MDETLHYDFCGTPKYISPEIFAKEGYVGHKADIWAAGVIVYKLYMGDFPFKGTSDKAIYRNISNFEFKSINGGCSEVDVLLSKMLDTDPMQRLSA